MKKLWIIFFLAFLPIHAVFAIRVSNLYQVEVPVISQSPEFKEEAIRTGFLQVLIKLTGDPFIDKNPLVKSSLQKADYFVQEFSYSTVTTHSSTYIIQIRFDNHSINHLLKQAGVLYWGEIRPLILVWLAITNKHHFTEIIGNETAKNISLDIKEEGKRYGLPLIFPMMDMEEVNQVPVSAVIGMQTPVLKAAGKRYSPDALLIGHIEENDEGLQSEWQLSLKDDKWNWTIPGKTTDEIIAFVMDRVSRTLAKHYAVTHITTPKSRMEIEVSHIRQRMDLKALIHSLQQLPPVLDIKLTQITGDVVNLLVLIRGPREAFENHAALTRHLILHAIETNDKSNDNKITYEWVK